MGWNALPEDIADTKILNSFTDKFKLISLVQHKSLDQEVSEDVLFLYSFHKNLSLIETEYQVSVLSEQQLLQH